MLVDDLRSAAERVAPSASPDLAERVLARLGEAEPTRRRWAVAVAAVATLLVALGLSPQVRAFAADLLERAGIVISDDEPDAARTPDEPLPGSELSDLERAADVATFPISVPQSLGEPESVTVVDDGRVVSMSWRNETVVLDQFEGSMGPVFEKQIGDLEIEAVTLDGTVGWWIPGPHALMYVDRDDEVIIATARLAGRTLIWERDGVTSRLEVRGLARREAVAIARSVSGTS
jgi:hypothetical protein